MTKTKIYQSTHIFLTYTKIKCNVEYFSQTLLIVENKKVTT